MRTSQREVPDGHARRLKLDEARLPLDGRANELLDIPAARITIPQRVAAPAIVDAAMAAGLTQQQGYLLYWIARGNMLTSVKVLGLDLPLESAVFAILLITATVVLPFWLWLSHRLGKHTAYIIGMVFWAGVQIGIFLVRPGQITLVMGMAFLAGLSVSAAHVLPDAMFPDVIEWDELRTGRRQEGIYYGVKNFVRKLTGALATFIALQVLGWFGYQTPPAGATTFMQPAVTLTAIRWLIGPLGAVLLFSAVITTWFYPLTRARHARIRRLLEKKNGRAAKIK
jgi:Na+/melibiose symporter-like transporter